MLDPRSGESEWEHVSQGRVIRPLVMGTKLVFGVAGRALEEADVKPSPKRVAVKLE